MDVEKTIEITRPAAAVWAVMTDVERWPEWTASISDVECLGGGPFDVGSQFRVRQPRLPVAVWTVTVLEKNRYFEWQALAPGLRSMGGHRVDAMSLNSARVTLTLNWSGWLAPLIRLLYAGLARRYVETEAAGLKRRCEAP